MSKQLNGVKETNITLVTMGQFSDIISTVQGPQQELDMCRNYFSKLTLSTPGKREKALTVVVPWANPSCHLCRYSLGW